MTESVSPPPGNEPPGNQRILAWIMGGLVVWGLFHAAGAWTFNHDVRRPLVVIACTAAFLGFWLVLLANRRKRLAARGMEPSSRGFADHISKGISEQVPERR
jgi:hypothetical protein